MNWPHDYITDEEAKLQIKDCQKHLEIDSSGTLVEVSFDFSIPKYEEIQYMILIYDSVRVCISGSNIFYIPLSYSSTTSFLPFLDVIIFDNEKKRYRQKRYVTLHSWDLREAPAWNLIVLGDRSHEHLVDLNMIPKKNKGSSLDN
jgi:hypothetical protein